MAEAKTKLNIFQKLEKARQIFQSRNIKKSGRNSFSKYDYFELGDIVPAKTDIFNDLGLCDVITFTEDAAVLTLYDTDTPESTLVFSSPMRTLELKGANAVQLLGGVETYLRRYLYMAMLDIVEADQFDGMAANDSRKPVPRTNNSNDPASSQRFVEEVAALVSPLTPEQKKIAGEIVKRYNNGSANVREITDPTLQSTILKALREANFNG